ncbi:hypothetical protein HY251_16940 [bacterium]|nr:hypothetical protein [bacterium]
MNLDRDELLPLMTALEGFERLIVNNQDLVQRQLFYRGHGTIALWTFSPPWDVHLAARTNAALVGVTSRLPLRWKMEIGKPQAHERRL